MHGRKDDKGKVEPLLVLGEMANAVFAVCDVATFGAQKYTRTGWLYVPDAIRRYTDAMLRHQLAEFSGQETDPESGMPHAAHAAWNALARLELQLRERNEYKNNR